VISCGRSEANPYKPASELFVGRLLILKIFKLYYHDFFVI